MSPFFSSALAFCFQGTLIVCVLVLGGSVARRAWVLGGCTLLNFALDCHLPGCLQVASMSRTFAGCVYIYAVYVSVGPGKFLLFSVFFCFWVGVCNSICHIWHDGNYFRVLCAHPLSFPPCQLKPVHYLRLLTSPQKMLISGDLKTYIATEQSRLAN